MGYAVVMSPCYSCGRVMSYHPHKVPSIRDGQGVRQPVCKECIDKGNPIRESKGLSPITYSEDAYSYCSEEEL